MGNGDGGLHPGEAARLTIHLSNQGNETARNVAGTLKEVVDHPDVEILDKFALWPDLSATGVPSASSYAALPGSRGHDPSLRLGGPASAWS